MSGASIYARLNSGERLSAEEVMTVAAAIDVPNGIWYDRVFVADHVERITFAGGDEFVRKREEEIVRCRDCDNLNKVGKCPCGFHALENPDGYCAWSKRKED